jgi:hypothetical protein
LLERLRGVLSGFRRVLFRRLLGCTAYDGLAFLWSLGLVVMRRFIIYWRCIFVGGSGSRLAFAGV